MTSLEGLSRLDLGADTNLLADLVKIFGARRRMNVRRSRFFDGEQALRDFGISIPPQMLDIGAALGWAGKGVRAVTDRSAWERFVLAGGNADPFDLDELLEQNHFEQEFAASKVSSAVHGCAFTSVTDGDTLSGEPDVLIMGRAAEESAAKWDRRRRSLAGFLSVIATKDDQPTEMVFYSPSTIYQIFRRGGRWQAIAQDNPLGEVPVVVHPYAFELRRPLGHSRITRAAMYCIQGAMRTMVRSEVSAELYSTIQLFLFGEGVTDLFGADRWGAQLGTVNAMDLEAKQDVPTLHRFSGQSPQPHIEQLRMFANLFADDQQLEVKFADTSNPASADAIFAAKEELITVTRNANRTWSYGANRIAQFAVRLRDGHGAAVPSELRKIRSTFTDPAIVSPSARAAAFSQLSTNIDGFGNSEVGMEFAGLSAEQISRFQAERTRDRGRDVLRQALAAGERVDGATVVAQS